MQNISCKNHAAKLRLAFFFVFLILLTPHVLYLFQPFFMDERPILANVNNFFFKATLVPIHAKYPTFYSYLAALPVTLGEVIHHVFGNFDSIRDTVHYFSRVEPLHLIFPARLLSLLFLIVGGAVSVRYCWKRFGAFAGAVVFAILIASPAFLRHGSYGLPDTAVFFFSALSLIFTLQFLDTFEDKQTNRYLLLASVFSGLAISTKYNALSTVVPIGFSIIYLYFNKKIRLTKAFSLIMIAAVTCIASFLVGSPGWLMAPELFYSEFMFEVLHAKRGHLGASGVPVLGNIELLIKNAPVVIGSALLGFLYWMKHRDRTGWIALIAIISAIALASTSAKQSLHYMYPAFPSFLIFSAMFWRAFEYCKRSVAVTAGFLALVLPAYGAFTTSIGYLQKNTTKLTQRWMYKNIQEGSKVSRDWAYVPKVYSHDDIVEMRKLKPNKISNHIEENNKVYKVIPFKPNSDWLGKSKAEYFVTSASCYNRFFKFGMFTKIEPKPDTELFKNFSTRREFYVSLFSSNDWEEVFSADTGNGPLTRVFRRRVD